MLLVVLAGLLLVGLAPPTTAQTPADPAIVAVYPNPVADGDRGEFLVVRVPRPGNWSVSDGESVARLPENVSGTVTVSVTPEATRSVTDRRVRRLAGTLALANGGERVDLRRDGTVVATAVYSDAPEGKLYRPSTGTWEALDATDRPVVTTDGGPGRAFVLPDAPTVAVEPLRQADRRILLAAYTFTSRRIATALVRAADRGVTVRVLVEGKPVGGMARQQARLLDRLEAAGIEVRVLGGPAPRYDFHHPKYAVVDQRAIVLTENWKPAGIGGRSSRGWGVVLTDPAATRALATTFRADIGGRDALTWRSFRRGRSFEPGSPANGTYETRHEPEEMSIRRTDVLVAPDNAEGAVISLLEGANESIRVIQPTLGGPDQPLVRAARRAAQRGVRVRILLSGAWYVRDENRRMADYLADRADARDLPLTVRLADPRGRYGKVHAKGVVVDGRRVALGSLNWNDHSADRNREVVVVLHGESIAGYYARVFDADWRGQSPGHRLPLGLAAGLAVAGGGALVFARRIRFE